MSVLIDLKGQRFGKLVAVRFLGRVNFHSMFQCLCDCGNLTVATSNNLRRNHTTSCGCESSKKTIGERTSTHGLSSHPLFKKWLDMKNRCYFEKHNRYEHYGGKGITVCDNWLMDFKCFYDWCKANGWKRGLQIDRKENNKNYCPENCRFATVKQQSRNRTSNVVITIDGVSKILIEWAEQMKANPTTIKARLNRGWSERDAVFGRGN